MKKLKNGMRMEEIVTGNTPATYRELSLNQKINIKGVIEKEEHLLFYWGRRLQIMNKVVSDDIEYAEHKMVMDNPYSEVRAVMRQSLFDNPYDRFEVVEMLPQELLNSMDFDDVLVIGYIYYPKSCSKDIVVEINEKLYDYPSQWFWQAEESFKEEEEKNLRYYTSENEEIENKLLSA